MPTTRRTARDDTARESRNKKTMRTHRNKCVAFLSLIVSASCSSGIYARRSRQASRQIASSTSHLLSRQFLCQVRGGAGPGNNPFRSPGITSRPNAPSKTAPSPASRQSEWEQFQQWKQREQLKQWEMQQSQEDSKARVVTDLSQRDSRVGFIRKVYAILGAQMLVTFGAILYGSLHKAELLPFILSPGGRSLQICCSVGAWLVVLLLRMRPSLQTIAPANYSLLGLFTIFESVVVSSFAMQFKTQSVLLAVAQT